MGGPSVTVRVGGGPGRPDAADPVRRDPRPGRGHEALALHDVHARRPLLLLVAGQLLPPPRGRTGSLVRFPSVSAT